MSEGDKRVDQYMVEVAKAIDHRGWSQEAETQIYNRCYEAIWKVIRDYSAERDRYKAEVEYEHRRRVAAEEIALEIEMISDFELSDFNNIKSCRTNLMQIHEAAMKLKSIIKEAGGMKEKFYHYIISELIDCYNLACEGREVTREKAIRMKQIIESATGENIEDLTSGHIIQG